MHNSLFPRYQAPVWQWFGGSSSFHLIEKRYIQRCHFRFCFIQISMNIRIGDVLIARNGEQYRVVECGEGIVSFMRVNGYTLFSCSARFAESMFGTVSVSSVM